MSTVSSKRKNLQELLFPRGIPPLWCPSLTHFDAGRRIDLGRMEAHLAWMMPNVKGYLVPGSTGDGWDLDDAETDTVVRFAVDMARRKGGSLLLGALRKNTVDVTGSIERFLDILRRLTGKTDPLAALIASGVSGFTVCPPAGKKRRSEIDFWPPLTSTTSSVGTMIRPNCACSPARLMRSCSARETLFSMPE